MMIYMYMFYPRKWQPKRKNQRSYEDLCNLYRNRTKLAIALSLSRGHLESSRRQEIVETGTFVLQYFLKEAKGRQWALNTYKASWRTYLASLLWICISGNRVYICFRPTNLEEHQKRILNVVADTPRLILVT